MLSSLGIEGRGGSKELFFGAAFVIGGCPRCVVVNEDVVVNEFVWSGRGGDINSLSVKWFR
jgi:hypothetical protein